MARRKRNPDLPVVAIVHWLDAARAETEPVSCLSVGWLVEMTPDKVVISGEILDDGHFDDDLTVVIPRGMVKKVRQFAMASPSAPFDTWTRADDV